MKKVLSMAMVLAMLTGAFSMTAFAAESQSVSVSVTISDANGKTVMAQEKITVTDVDNDGALTIHDALYHAHEAGYEGGAAAGYATSVGQWGLSLDKLWGTANGGSYGYVVNNVSAMSLVDPIQEGDYINAYVYTDLTAWSDQYCYFDVNTLSAKAGEEITLTLMAAGYDADWNPVVLPVTGATITVNGEATQYKTDDKGSVTLKMNEIGEAVISATSQTQTLVPPVCILTVTEAVPETPEVPSTGDCVLLVGSMALAAIVMGTVALVSPRKKVHEN